jgi:DNA-binding transcriptional LysR family regulator
VNWDDLKILLSLSRYGSTRKAAAQLGVSNTTVMRRLDGLEEALAGKLFDRTPDGFQATALAAELLPIAQGVEETLNEAERRLVGMDAQLTGGIKVSLPLWSAHPIYDALANFSQRYPGIDLDISASDDHVDLARREADLAIRGMPKEKRPPKDIVGIKLMPIYIGYYVHTNLLTEAAKGLRELTYIGSAPVHTQGELVTAGSLGLSGRHLFHSLMPRLMAVKHQLGVAVLPSMMAADDPELLLLPNVPAAHWGYIWVLHHKDLRQSARIRALFKYLSVLEEG